MRYSGISDRIKAMFFDMVIIGVLMFFTTWLLGLFDHVPSEIRSIAFILIVFLYEPLCVSIFSGTLGHYSHNLRVRSVDG